MSTSRDTADFEALDACHRQIHQHLAELTTLADTIAARGVARTVAQQAGTIETFFSGTSRQHHAEEERTVFPSLLESQDTALVAAVRTLQQDHGWIEENWIDLAPQLRAIAQGHHWVDLSEFRHAAQVFGDLCEGHIALEESLVYPAAKAHWAQALAKRAAAAARPP